LLESLTDSNPYSIGADLTDGHPELADDPSGRSSGARCGVAQATAPCRTTLGSTAARRVGGAAGWRPDRLVDRLLAGDRRSVIECSLTRNGDSQPSVG
jgi:hypothetical protein